MREKHLLWSLIVLTTICVPALAVDGSHLNWEYQQTGFQSGGNNQTAVAMRDGRVWPVIFAEDNSSPSMVQAYSLYPVMGPVGTFWHQIGTNLLDLNPGGVPGALSAATSPDGRIGAVARAYNGDPHYSAAVVGGSPGGFGPAQYEVLAIDFDSQGNLIKGTASTVPGAMYPLVDISVSAVGDLGAVDADMWYHQNSPMMGGWGSVDLKYFGPQLFPESMDLAIDALGCPHILGTDQSTGDLVAYDFDPMNGQWTSQTLGSCPPSSVAVDSQGLVGAAWVELYGPGDGVLKYAYKDGTDPWVTTTVTSSVFNQFTAWYEDVSSMQSVGLVFDNNDFPVISFVTNVDNNIWLAYDPVPTPEPSSLALLGVGAVLLMFAGWRRRLRRVGK